MDGLGAVDFAEFSAVLFPDVKLKPEDSAADKFASAASTIINQQRDEKKKAEESMKKSAAQKADDMAKDVAALKEAVQTRLGGIDEQIAALAHQVSQIHELLRKGGGSGPTGGGTSGGGSSGGGHHGSHSSSHDARAATKHRSMSRARSSSKDMHGTGTREKSRSQSRGRPESAPPVERDYFFGVDAADAVPTRDRPDARSGHRSNHSRGSSPDIGHSSGGDRHGYSSSSPSPDHRRTSNSRRGLTPARPEGSRRSASGSAEDDSGTPPSDETLAAFKLRA
jgi:hypothetical protein